MFRALLLTVMTAYAAELDLTKAHIVAPAERKAVQTLVEEIEKRTQIRLPVDTAGSGPVIRIDKSGQPKLPAEGFSLKTGEGSITLHASDSRGVLFGVGRLLREMRLTKGHVSVATDLDIVTAPKYPLRGHQLGYRPKTNSYDGWSVPVWEQYIRDLAVFGTNAVELIPPRSDDAASSPHFPLPPMDMMVEMSRLLGEYGLDVWIWYPAMDKDYSDPKTVEFALDEWETVFRKLPRIDAIFVPGGDPGHTQPKYLLALLEKQAERLHKYHPKAQMWVSPQSFSAEWLDEFIDILNKQQPAWLSGVVFGPQVRISLPKLRSLVPKRYPIRHYPDITHSRQCQYPVPDWDAAFAMTEGREVINPRPVDEARIFRLLAPHTVGFITYSEGCNDDVNKFVWSALGWDPDMPVIEILRQYSRYFLGERYTEDFAQGLLALERDWRGPLLANVQVDTTIGQFRALERTATPADKTNWRFQQALYRAYYDAYTRRRLITETTAEQEAMERLRAAKQTGAVNAMAQAEVVLERAASTRVAEDWRARVFELGEALFQSIRMQLSVERYQAISVDRGATLDTIDVPLNNRLWLEQRFAEIRQMNLESDRLASLDAIVNWTNPGPGGFYDDLGNPSAQPHLVRGRGFEADPAFLESALTGFGPRGTNRTSWWTHAEALYETPLQMRYTDLDRGAAYKLRVVYAGDSGARKMRLLANDKIEIHPYIAKPLPFRPLEFDIPREATASGSLVLTWYGEAGLGGNGRGNQVSEVWLIRK